MPQGGQGKVRFPEKDERTLTWMCKVEDAREWPSVTATMSYLNSAMPPVLGQLLDGSVVRVDIARFFHVYGRRRPDGANQGHDILRNMFDCANAWGHRPDATGNPCKGSLRFRRPARGQPLGANDLASLGTVLRRRKDENPVCAPVMRLLLLTGCTLGEIRRLQWCKAIPGRFAPIDAKTGPRHVLLGVAAKLLLNGLAETAS